MHFRFCSAKKEINIIEDLKKLETDIYSISELNCGTELMITEVPIKFQEETQNIHTASIIKKEHSLNLVILHGYGGSGLTFYRIIKELSNFYNIWLIDFIGMGLSSRPTFSPTDTNETIKYFLDSIELWRNSVGLKDFYLAGHSLGGYIASCYSVEYPDIVKGLLLISAAGVTHRTKEEMDEMEKDFVNKSYIKKQFVKFAKYLWDKKTTPNSILKKNKILGKFLMKRYFKKRWDVKGQEAEMLSSFYQGVLTLPTGSEKAVHFLLKMPRALGIIPIETLFEEKGKVRTLFLYGSIDWMDNLGGFRLSRMNPNLFTYREVSNAGHHINIDNPEELVNYMVEFIKELENKKDKKDNLIKNHNKKEINILEYQDEIQVGY